MELQHTLEHLACPACAQTRRELALLGQYGIPKDVTFKEAAKIWVDTLTFNGSKRHRYISDRTLKDDVQYIRALNRYFAHQRLCDIHIGHIRHYQEQRAAGKLGPSNEELVELWGAAYARKLGVALGELRLHPDWIDQLHEVREVGPNKINQEVSVLVRILKRANLWGAELQDLYQPLAHEESDIPRAMTPQEQDRLLLTASTRPEWELVYHYALVALHTTCSTCEMLGIQLGDLNLHGRLLYIRKGHAKNQYRIRTIPLDDDSHWAAGRLLDRAYAAGCGQPSHYLFPFKAGRADWDPTKPMSHEGPKKPWDEVRRAAGLPWLRLHDLRHTAITRFAEAGTPIPTIMSLAGHISRRMMEHYTHISEQAQRRAQLAAYPPSQRSPHRMAAFGPQSVRPLSYAAEQ